MSKKTSDWLKNQHQKQTEKVKAMRPRPGQYAQLDTWFGDVWGEIKRVSSDSMMLYVPASSDKEEGAPTKAVYTFFHDIRKVTSRLPRDTRLVNTAKGKHYPKGQVMATLAERVARRFEAQTNPGGRAEEKRVKESDFPKATIEKGIKVELEHTDDRDTAKKIVLDHLAESEDYYDALEEMEEKLEADKEAAPKYHLEFIMGTWYEGPDRIAQKVARRFEAAPKEAGTGPKWEKGVGTFEAAFQKLVQAEMKKAIQGMAPAVAKLFEKLAKDSDHEFRKGVNPRNVAKDFVVEVMLNKMDDEWYDEWAFNNFFRQGDDMLEPTGEDLP